VRPLHRQLLRIKDERKLDPKAFMFIQYIKEASGGILRNKQKTFLKERIMLLDSMIKVSTYLS
jgi:hypothetical protein